MNTAHKESEGSLSPPAKLLPPQGCQGAVTGWPQLLSALDSIAADFQGANDIHKRFGSADPARFGGPGALALTLAANPTALTGPRPPIDLYGHFVWFVTKVANSAETIAQTLTQIPSLLEHSPGGGTMAREVVTGLGARALSMSSLANDLVSGLAGSVRAYEAALKRQAEAASSLERVAVAAANPAKSFDQIRVGAQGKAVATGAHQAAAAYDAVSAAVSANAVLANIEQAVTTMSAAWREWSDRTALAGTQAPASLDKPAYWREQLDLDRAASEWGAYALQVRSYLPGLFAIRIH